MSAALVTHDENGARIPMPAERAETLANIPQFAESLDRMLLRDKRDGQLWERVAEGHKVKHSEFERMRYSVAMLTHDALKREIAEPNTGDVIGNYRGMPLGASVKPSEHQGIIRAGERIR